MRPDPLYAESLYQMACAAGDAAGCVNRAAGLRNTSYAGDPYPKRPAAARLACQLKSFSLGYAADDAWGCTMRGQAELLDEGVTADAAAAPGFRDGVRGGPAVRGVHVCEEADGRAGDAAAGGGWGEDDPDRGLSGVTAKLRRPLPPRMSMWPLACLAAAAVASI